MWDIQLYTMTNAGREEIMSSFLRFHIVYIVRRDYTIHIKSIKEMNKDNQ